MVSQALVGLAVSLRWVVTGVGWCWQVCPFLPPQPHTGTLLCFTLLYSALLLHFAVFRTFWFPVHKRMLLSDFD
jgi:hypothetical protein